METLNESRTVQPVGPPYEAAGGPTTETPSISRPISLMMAALSLGAGAIHLAMVPSHAGEWMAEGVAFAIAGWLQVVLAIVFLVRPSRLAVGVACAVNAVFIVAWVVTRTAGPPFGPEAGVVHDASFVDIACVALEAAIVVAGVLVWLRPQIGHGMDASWRVPLSLIPIAVLVLATAAIVSPSAVEHGHDETAAGGHVHDEGTTTGSETTSAEGGHVHGSAEATTASGDDKGLALLSNGEMAHVYGPDQPLDRQTQAALTHQLALTRLITDAYPTLADAKAAGSTPAGAFVPGLGIHMGMPLTGIPSAPTSAAAVSIPGTLSDEQILHPTSLLYSGTNDDSPIAGLMYTVMTMGEPEGFAGPNDHWHSHGNLCLRFTPDGIKTIQAEGETQAACSAAGGQWIAQTTYMVHVWTVPGYESNRGVFSDVNPAITCSDGSYYQVTQAETDRYQVNKCQADAA